MSEPCSLQQLESVRSAGGGQPSAPSSVMQNGGGITVPRAKMYSKRVELNIKIKVTIYNKGIKQKIKHLASSAQWQWVR